MGTVPILFGTVVAMNQAVNIKRLLICQSGCNTGKNMAESFGLAAAGNRTPTGVRRKRIPLHRTGLLNRWFHRIECRNMPGELMFAGPAEKIQ